jgi:hypothetical protein
MGKPPDVLPSVDRVLLCTLHRSRRAPHARRTSSPRVEGGIRVLDTGAGTCVYRTSSPRVEGGIRVPDTG